MQARGYPLDQSSLFRYEEGSRVPNVAVLALLADIYRAKFSDFCEALAAEVLGRDVPSPPAVLTEREAAVLAAYHRLDRNPTVRDRWVLVGQDLPEEPATESDVVA